MSKDVSKKLSWLLRHAARAEGLTMDDAGWVNVAAVTRYFGITLKEIGDLVGSNTKDRLQLDGATGRIRCCQGHSEGSGVTADALEASWSVFAGSGLIWHGTNVDAVPSIAASGLLPQARTHVHLAPDMGSKVGKRAGVDVLLGVGTELLRAFGVQVFEAQNGVLLARRVPPECILALHGQTKAGQAQEYQLRRLFEQYHPAAITAENTEN